MDGLDGKSRVAVSGHGVEVVPVAYAHAFAAGGLPLTSGWPLVSGLPLTQPSPRRRGEGTCNTVACPHHIGCRGQTRCQIVSLRYERLPQGSFSPPAGRRWPAGRMRGCPAQAGERWLAGRVRDGRRTPGSCNAAQVIPAGRFPAKAGLDRSGCFRRHAVLHGREINEKRCRGPAQPLLRLRRCQTR